MAERQRADGLLVEVGTMNSRQKGARGERALAKKLREYGYTASRGQQYSGKGAADVETDMGAIHIECKYTAKGHGLLYEWLAQAKRDAKTGEVPVVMHRHVSNDARGLPWLVTMEIDDFMALWGEKGK